jgi:hypothetical protein
MEGNRLGKPEIVEPAIAEGARMSRGMVGTVGIVGLVLLGVAAHAQLGKPRCSSEACVSLKKILAARSSDFAALRGTVLFRRPDGMPGEYAGKASLPGAKSCTVEIVGAAPLYLCVLPNEPYPKVEKEYTRYTEYIKEAIPPNWVTWEQTQKAESGQPGSPRFFRAGPSRGQVVLEATLLAPAEKLPHLTVVVYRTPLSLPVGH